MKKRERLTPENILKKEHYANIIQLIGLAQIQNKKIRFTNLRYFLVRDTKIPDKELQHIPKSSIFYNIIKSKKMTVNNLTNFLKRLIEIGFIEKKKGKKRNKNYYVLTRKGLMYSIRADIEEEVDFFLDHVFNKKRMVKKSVEMLTRFNKDIEESVLRLVSSE